MLVKFGMFIPISGIYEYCHALISLIVVFIYGVGGGLYLSFEH